MSHSRKQPLQSIPSEPVPITGCAEKPEPHFLGIGWKVSEATINRIREEEMEQGRRVRDFLSESIPIG